jgi:hypothetical protein
MQPQPIIKADFDEIVVRLDRFEAVAWTTAIVGDTQPA